jgi:DNA replication and repair protein RecF
VYQSITKGAKVRLQSLQLSQFKNYENVFLEFSGKVHCFYGNNGAGKTNILDAIHYLSFTKSYFGGSDQLSIRFGDEYFAVLGNFEMPSGVTEKISVSVKEGGDKRVKRNDKDYQRFSEHIGLFPIVMITPGDIDLINNASEVRRRFFDSVISQFDRTYLDDLIRYNKVLLQRNRLLKDMNSCNDRDFQKLEVWNTQLVGYAKKIHQSRLQYHSAFSVHHEQMHEKLTQQGDITEIEYQSALHEADMNQLLVDNFAADLAAGYTTQGVHRDDYLFMVNENPVKRFGSQGQQKSFLLALKMAQYLITVEKTGLTPILLFDDIFDKLDPDRVRFLIDMVCHEPFGQVFITDTHKMRMEGIIGLQTKIQLFEVGGGNVK